MVPLFECPVFGSPLNSDFTFFFQDQSTGGVGGGESDAQKIVKISYKSDVWSLGCILVRFESSAL